MNCDHCGTPIIKKGTIWYHKISDTIACVRETVASPPQELPRPGDKIKDNLGNTWAVRGMVEGFGEQPGEVELVMTATLISK